MISRHKFLRLSGLSLCALAGGKFLRAIGGVNRTGTAGRVRWGMAFDTVKCSQRPDCTECTAACHQAHNVPDIADRRHEVRWLWREPFQNAFGPQDQYSEKRDAPVMVTCNHCDNPPCVRVCPTQATWQRDDGIVMMDWHRCIGCRYCIAACPYGARSFNWEDPRPSIHHPNPEFPTRTKGVVEKCTMCEERLATGRLPACVEACPEKALIFGNLADPRSEIREVLRSRRHLRRKPELGTGPNVFYLV